MVKKRQIILFVAVAVFVAAAGVWYYLITKDKREIHALVGNAASLISKKADDLPHAGMLKHVKTDELFCRNVVLKTNSPSINLTISREDLKSKIALWLRMIDHMQVKVAEVEIEVSGKSAVFTFAAEVSGKANLKNEKFADVYNCTGSAEKIDGKWRIAVLTAEPVLQ